MSQLRNETVGARPTNEDEAHANPDQDGDIENYDLAAVSGALSGSLGLCRGFAEGGSGNRSRVINANAARLLHGAASNAYTSGFSNAHLGAGHADRIERRRQLCPHRIDDSRAD
jgi:hypothetical protein